MVFAVLGDMFFFQAHKEQYLPTSVSSIRVYDPHLGDDPHSTVVLLGMVPLPRLDAAAVGLLGALLLYANNGQETAEGWLLGAVFAVLYLILLQQDVSVITVAWTSTIGMREFSPLLLLCICLYLYIYICVCVYVM